MCLHSRPQELYALGTGKRQLITLKAVQQTYKQNTQRMPESWSLKAERRAGQAHSNERRHALERGREVEAVQDRNRLAPLARRPRTHHCAT